MKKVRSMLLSILVLTPFILLTNCKKYDEGPGISVKSKKSRVSNTWKVEYAFDFNDNIEVTADYVGETWELSKEGDFTEKDNGQLDKTGTWEFSNEKETLQFNIVGTGSSTETFTILKLKEKEMWLKDKDEELHLVPAN